MKSVLYKTTTFITVLSLAFIGATTVHAEEASTTVKPPLVQKVRESIENRAAKNSEIRNNQLQKMEVRMDLKADLRANMQLMHPSSTDMFKKGGEMRSEMAKKMQLKTFEIRKAALVKQLTVSISNLTTLSARIESRIVKSESENRSMTDARTLLVAANSKLEKAKADVAAFEALTASSTPASASTTAEIELTKPRVLGDAAIKSVKEARDAYKKVVEAIAKALGVGLNASTTVEANASVRN